MAAVVFDFNFKLGILNRNIWYLVAKQLSGVRGLQNGGIVVFLKHHDRATNGHLKFFPR